VPTLTRIMNVDFSHGVFPRELKIARVRPIFKGSDPLDENNYRPISVLSSLRKIYEALMKNKLEEHFTECAIITPHNLIL
jgi:hypothetical protein